MRHLFHRETLPGFACARSGQRRRLLAAMHEVEQSLCRARAVARGRAS